LLRRFFAIGATFVAITSFCTGVAGASEARTARATVNQGAIALDGKPFFPVMLIDQCASDDVARATQLGVNLILNEHCENLSASAQLEMIQSSSLAVLPVATPDVRGRGLVGWTFPDEPENNGWTATKLRESFPYPRGNADGLLSFVTTGGGFFKPPYRDSRVAPAEYRQITQVADVAGFDLYPLGHCQQDLSAVYEAQREFVQLAGGMPTFQWIETGPIKPTYCGGFTMSPAQLRAEVWLAIAGGARGIGYFTHTWSPEHRAVDVSPSLRWMMSKISALLAAVRPGLVGKTLPASSNSGGIKVLARTSGNTTYVFAVNALAQPIKVQLSVPQLRDGRLQAFGEKRSLTVRGHQFIDRFGPLAVHVYVQSSS
jgi:hypothetical protein